MTKPQSQSSRNPAVQVAIASPKHRAKTAHLHIGPAACCTINEHRHHRHRCSPPNSTSSGWTNPWSTSAVRKRDVDTGSSRHRAARSGGVSVDGNWPGRTAPVPTDVAAVATQKAGYIVEQAVVMIRREYNHQIRLETGDQSSAASNAFSTSSSTTGPGSCDPSTAHEDSDRCNCHSDTTSPVQAPRSDCRSGPAYANQRLTSRQPGANSLGHKRCSSAGLRTHSNSLRLDASKLEPPLTLNSGTIKHVPVRAIKSHRAVFRKRGEPS